MESSLYVKHMPSIINAIISSIMGAKYNTIQCVNADFAYFVTLI